MINIKICLENTAINTGVAKSVKNFYPLIRKNGNVIDYGAGKLRNSLFLLNNGFKVSIIETEIQLNRIKDINPNLLDRFVNVFNTDNIPNIKYDAVISTFIFCVIYNLQIREQIIHNIYNLLNDNGIAIIETRSEKSILNAKYKQNYLDGFLIGKNEIKTFQKPYTLDEFIKLFELHNFDIIQSKTYGDSITIIVKKGELTK